MLVTPLEYLGLASPNTTSPTGDILYTCIACTCTCTQSSLTLYPALLVYWWCSISTPIMLTVPGSRLCLLCFFHELVSWWVLSACVLPLFSCCGRLMQGVQPSCNVAPHLLHVGITIGWHHYSSLLVMLVTLVLLSKNGQFWPLPDIQRRGYRIFPKIQSL